MMREGGVFVCFFKKILGSFWPILVKIFQFREEWGWSLKFASLLCVLISLLPFVHFEMEAHFDVLKGVGIFYILHLEII
jgi:hypothetical protein